MTTRKKGIYTSKPEPADQHEKIERNLKSKKWIGWLILIFSVLLSIAIFVQHVVSIKSQVIDPGKIDGTVVETVKASADKTPSEVSRTEAIEELFSLPYVFFSDTSKNRILPNQSFGDIFFSSDNVDITVTPSDPECHGYKYAMANKVIGGIKVHELLPLNNFMTTNFEVARSYYDTQEGDDGFNSDSALRKWNSCVYANTENAELDEFEELVKFDNPGVVVKVNNNSGENIQINSIEARVKASSKNPYPLLHFEDGLGGELQIFNYGSGNIKDLKLEFDLQPVSEAVRYDRPFKHKLKINSVKERSKREFDIGNNDYLTSFLIAEGVSENALEYIAGDGLPDDFLDNKNRLKAKYCGNYPDAQVRMVGKAIYSAKTASGKVYKDTVNFNCIQYFLDLSIGGGTIGVNRGRYHILLDKSGKNYSKSFSVEKNIPPKSGSSFDLVFFSGVYSYHYMDLVIHYNGAKEIVLPDFFLNEFLTAQDMNKIGSKLATKSR